MGGGTQTYCCVGVNKAENFSKEKGHSACFWNAGNFFRQLFPRLSEPIPSAVPNSVKQGKQPKNKDFGAFEIDLEKRMGKKVTVKDIGSLFYPFDWSDELPNCK